MTTLDDSTSGESSRFNKVIGNARKKKQGETARTPSGDVNTSTPFEKPPDQFLRTETQEGLAGLTKAMKRIKEEEAQQKEVESVEAEKRKALEPDETPQEKLERLERAGVEKLLKAMDIGEFLTNNVVSQVVPVLPGKLVVTFSTIETVVEVSLDKRLAAEGILSTRHLIRIQNIYALATHIDKINQNEWPALLNGDGSVNQESLDFRINAVSKLNSVIFSKIYRHFAWFLTRVNNLLTVENVGNG